MFSIIVPVYNVAKYINRCVDSILSQNCSDFELILVDDGSTDGSGEICDSYKHDKRVRIIHTANMGVSCARNTGLDLSAGDYIWFIDADDWIAPDALTILSSFQGEADLVLFGCCIMSQTENGSLLKQEELRVTSLPGASAISKNELFKISVSLHNKLIKRSCIGSIRFIQGLKYGEDAVFYHRILENIHSAITLPDMLYYYHKDRPGNTVSGSIDEKSLDLLASATMSYDILKGYGDVISGINRILVSINEVLTKMVNNENTADYVKYLDYCCKAARYPAAIDKLKYLINSKTDYKLRIWYFSALLNPFHFKLILARRKRRC